MGPLSNCGQLHGNRVDTLLRPCFVAVTLAVACGVALSRCFGERDRAHHEVGFAATVQIGLQRCTNTFWRGSPGRMGLRGSDMLAIISYGSVCDFSYM